MLERIGGPAGVLGLVALLGGVALLYTVDPRIAAGIALVIVGTGLVVRGLVKGLLGRFGVGGLV